MPPENIYFDHNATTPLDPEVAAVMAEVRAFGNPSSMHQVGQEARRWVDRARTQVARFIGAATEDIVFTSGGTEANNLAILGAVRAQKGRTAVVTSAIEHHSVLGPCEYLQTRGRKVSLLPVEGGGQLSLPALEASANEQVALYSVMWANNDTGVILPIEKVVATAHRVGAKVHLDAVQAAGKLVMDVEKLPVDLLTLSSHKIYGPKGVGALFVRRGVELVPLTFGGKQERVLRAGTENLLGIVGFGKACELAQARLTEDRVRMEGLRDLFEANVRARIPRVQRNGEGDRLANTSNLSFDGVDGEAILINLDLVGIAVSLGSACSAASKDPSHVLLAMGRTESEARSSVRFSLGRHTTQAEIHKTVEILCQIVALLRGRTHG